MKIEYFEDTDTLQITFKKDVVSDTHDLDENTVVEWDAGRQLVTITLEHSRRRTELESLLYRVYPGSST